LTRLPSRSRLSAMPALWMALSGCGNACMELCQQHEVYLDECGYGWSTAFADQGWASIEDCYADAEEASEGHEKTCAQDLDQADERSCY
jgi:hypothetical protein